MRQAAAVLFVDILRSIALSARCGERAICPLKTLACSGITGANVYADMWHDSLEDATLHRYI
jgi:hypothetical protein